MSTAHNGDRADDLTFIVLNDDEKLSLQNQPACQDGDCTQLFSCCNARCNCAFFG
jgi:hypothetical protein